MNHFDTAKHYKHELNCEWSDEHEPVPWMHLAHQIMIRELKDSTGTYLRFKSPLNCLQYGPLRGKSKRLLYGKNSEFSRSGEHMPYLIRAAEQKQPIVFKSIIDFGKKSGLYDDIKTVSIKTAIKDKPFTVQIKRSNSIFYIDELGFGVSQILPIISDIAYASNNYAFLIQQPELHLHPKAQAALGDVFLEAAQHGGMFVIETHSDFLVDRYRMSMSKCASDLQPRSQIIYFEEGKDGSENIAYEMEISKSGAIENTPDGYRSFFLEEAVEKFELL